MRSFDIKENLRSSLWFIPTVCVLGAVILAFVLIEIDRSGFDGYFLFAGEPEGARNLRPRGLGPDASLGCSEGWPLGLT
jgi:uncharacterized membrane protein